MFNITNISKKIFLIFEAKYGSFDDANYADGLVLSGLFFFFL